MHRGPLSSGWLAAAVVTGLALLPPCIAAAERLTPERVYANPGLSGKSPRGVEFSPDGAFLTYLQPQADAQLVLDLWAIELETGERRKLVDASVLEDPDHVMSEEEIARRERKRIRSSGIISYQWDEQGTAILTPISGDLYLVENPTSKPKLRRITSTEADETDAKISPQGGYILYVRDGELYAFDLAADRERRVSPPAKDTVTYGTAELVAQEEMYRFTGYWPSPGDTRVAYTQVDVAGVDQIERFDVGADGVNVYRQRYPRAGRPNADVKLFVAGIDGSDPVEVDLGIGKDGYLARVDWLSDSRLTVQVQNRPQTRLELREVDLQTGQTQLLIEEEHSAWINLHTDLTPLADGTQFLWSSESTGFRHISLHGEDGKRIRWVTRGEWAVSETERRGGAIVAVDEKDRTVYFLGFRDTPFERHLYRVRYDRESEPERLTTPGYYWSVSMNRTATAFAGTRSSVNQPRQVGLYDRDGKRKAWIEENVLDADHPYGPFVGAHVTPSFGKLKTDDGHELNYTLYVPEGCTKTKRCPAIHVVYAGPGHQVATQGWPSPRTQLFAQNGYVVLYVDARGTPHRGRVFEDAIYRKLGTVEVADQLAGMRWLKKRPEVDPDRVGVWGWSYGGYMVLKLMTQAPDAYAAGVSGAPVTDWSLYDTHYTERYLGTPQDNAAGYEASSVLPSIEKIRRPLLMIHGMSDDNVTFDQSTRVYRALQEAKIPFEVMVYPGERHGIYSPGPRIHSTITYFDFLQRHLQSP